jgi:hypothetical protein
VMRMIMFNPPRSQLRFAIAVWWRATASHHRVTECHYGLPDGLSKQTGW